MTDYEGVTQIILAEPSITSLLGVFYNGEVATSQPLVLTGTIPEGQKERPAISIRNANNVGDYGISMNFIQVHCYASTEAESRVVAQAVYDYFRNSRCWVTGFAAAFEASIITSTPSEKETNTVVQLQLNYR